MPIENTIDVYIKVQKEGRIPEYGSKSAAGCDLYATEDMAIRPGEIKLMPLGFIMAIDAEMEAQIRPRSGLSLKTDLRLPNSPGTIDSDYRDSVSVIFQNTYNISNLPYEIAENPELLKKLKSEYKEIDLADYLTKIKNIDSSGYEKLSMSILNEKIYIDNNLNPLGTIYIKKGERIAQMVFSEYKRANFIEHNNPKEIGYDRGGGFGHTGV
jgi:dUTP pyrophosphatase